MRPQRSSVTEFPRLNTFARISEVLSTHPKRSEFAGSSATTAGGTNEEPRGRTAHKTSLDPRPNSRKSEPRHSSGSRSKNGGLPAQSHRLLALSKRFDTNSAKIPNYFGTPSGHSVGPPASCQSYARAQPEADVASCQGPVPTERFEAAAARMILWGQRRDRDGKRYGAVRGRRHGPSGWSGWSLGQAHPNPRLTARRTFGLQIVAAGAQAAGSN